VVDKEKFIWMDGKLVDWANAQVHVLTHTLHYGMGAFEGIRAYELTDGRSAVFRLKEHMRRLLDSCHIGQMECPHSLEDLCKAAKDLLSGNGMKAGYLRPVVYTATAAWACFPGEPDPRVHRDAAGRTWAPRPRKRASAKIARTRAGSPTR
jgi:branched-chain amino acid aminotransferase